MQYEAILIHWGELGLKGRNRPRFIDRLAGNVAWALKGLPVKRVRKLPGRLWVQAREGEFLGDEAIARLQTVFGISSFSPAVRADLELEAIQRAAWSLAEPRTYETFRVSARRAFKDLPFRSQELNEQVGSFLWEQRQAKVKMKGADLDVRIEVLPSGAYLYADKFPGLGGLPQGMTGKVCVMLSGGIDSPVAAFRMMRRGCRVVMVHFHSHPFVTRASLEKAEDLAAHLMRYQYDGRLYSVAFGEIQRTIVEAVPPPLRVVLYRRMMVRISEALGRRERCKALVSGESLAQVASQTLSNLVVIDDAASIPVLRPLIGLDKYEIIEQAQALGTFEISVLPDQDCCTLFTPRNPETHAKLDRVLEAESKLDLQALVAGAVEAAERMEVRAPWWRPGKPRPGQAGPNQGRASEEAPGAGISGETAPGTGT